MKRGIIHLPQQRLSYKKKTKKWRISNIEHADTFSLYNNNRIRKSLKNKVINLNLYNGIVDVQDISSIVNPYHMDASFIPDNIPHHPILVPKVDLLVGEEIKRRFDWTAIVTNPNAISDKEDEKKKVLQGKLMEFLQANYKEDELKAKLKELEHYLKYDWQDIRERMANQILRHYWKEQDFGFIFNKCYKDALINAEEICQIEIVHNEPTLTKLNSLKVRTVRSGGSDRIEDSSIIILEDHWSPGKIIDYFHEELKEGDIDYIMDYETSSDANYRDDDNHTLLRDALDAQGEPFMDDIFNIAEINGHYFNSNLTDEDGNIRVFRVYWKSLKKVKKIKYYDEFGETQYKIRSEEYIVDKEMGEESTNMWINEWWEGTKIGKDIYIQMRPMEVQYNRINNPSICHPGIIGQIYNTNQGKAVSLVDRAKNYQYMYDIMWDRLNKAIATNYGKILELDLAKVPENWEIDKWLHFAVTNKIAVVDSFKEGNKGAATGKLAGGMNAVGGRSIDMETGSYIQQHIQMLEYIKMEMGEVCGISEQRQGQVSTTETVGGVERAINQSANITEYWFNIHENFKIRVLTAFLEAAKIALKGNNKKAQYILDDLSIQVLNMGGDVFPEADYGIVCTSSYQATLLEQNIKQLSQAFLQNGGGLSTIMDIYTSPSLADMRKKLELAEQDIAQRQQEASQQQNKIAQQELANKRELEVAKLELEDTISQRDNATKKYIAELKALEGVDRDSDGITDELDSQKLQLERQKVIDDKMLKIKELNDEMIQHKDKMDVEKKKISSQANKKVTK